MSWNDGIIDEFRANAGTVGGRFEGRPLLLLHHTGARSGIARVSPLMYQAVDGGYAVFASKGGADANPAWYYNLLANPETTVEVGADTVAVKAREIFGDEYDRIWTKQKLDFPELFGTYEQKTARDHIPALMLDLV